MKDSGKFLPLKVFDLVLDQKPVPSNPPKPAKKLTYKTMLKDSAEKVGKFWLKTQNKNTENEPTLTEVLFNAKPKVPSKTPLVPKKNSTKSFRPMSAGTQKVQQEAKKIVSTWKQKSQEARSSFKKAENKLSLEINRVMDRVKYTNAANQKAISKLRKTLNNPDTKSEEFQELRESFKISNEVFSINKKHFQLDQNSKEPKQPKKKTIELDLSFVKSAQTAPEWYPKSPRTELISDDESFMQDIPSPEDSF